MGILLDRFFFNKSHDNKQSKLTKEMGFQIAKENIDVYLLANQPSGKVWWFCCFWVPIFSLRSNHEEKVDQSLTMQL